MTDARPLRIAILDDYEIVVQGLRRMFEPFADRVTMVGAVEMTATVANIEPADIVLYDTFSQARDADATVDIAEVLGRSRARKLVIYSWNAHPELARIALTHGASGYLSKRLAALELVEALERIRSGTAVVTEDEPLAAPEDGEWPGRCQGLTGRESEIILLITQGLSNQQIADRAFLSINSVKSYIRSSYRKMHVSSRSQAVLWGIAHGFRPDQLRVPNAPRNAL